MNAPHRVVPDVEVLARLFHPSVDVLGSFDEVDAGDMPQPYRRLLAHQHHMTVTVEAHHGSPVDVQVLQRRATATHYAREILLRRQSDGAVVQYGIMRVNLGYLDGAVRREIERESAPLGRILIEHDVLRSIHLFSLWRIEPGEVLRRHLAARPGRSVYGRTALISCNGEPAIELLEIVR